QARPGPGLAGAGRRAGRRHRGRQREEPPVSAELPEVTAYLLDTLEWRYAVPRCCRVCGAPLEVADSRGMKMTCTSDAASPLRSLHAAAGVTLPQALDHWQESTLYDPPDG